MNVDNRRRRFWINPRYQGRYLLTILLLELIVMAATAILSFSLAFILIDPDFEAGPSWAVIFTGFITVLLMAAAALIYLGVHISHKVCGPALRLQKTLEAVRRGEKPAAIHLRDGDDLQELTEALNGALGSLGLLETSAAPPKPPDASGSQSPSEATGEPGP
ncbi:hypothetical protein IIC65_02020 [Candidatus Sumerlaeota bacterium]|nr:hypothetical protein [Candidatus Sumerlaeota bacterium]